MDLDEGLVTHTNIDTLATPTYSDLLTYLDNTHPTAAYYRFSNVFYLPPAEIPKDQFLLSFHTHKHLTPTPNGARTKCIYKPHRMSQVYTHYGLPINSTYHEVVVPATLANLHHYRRHSPPGGFHKSEYSEDYTIVNRYGEKIRSSEVYKVFEKELKGNLLKV